MPFGRSFFPRSNSVGDDMMHLCEPHFSEVGDVLEVTEEFRLVSQAEWLKVDTADCMMCNTEPAEGNVCYREECGRPLPHRWPAVYCSNRCADLDR